MQGFELTKQHGQHLLANPLVIKSIVEKAEIRSTDTVLEIGPGTGNLTLALLEKAKHVIAVEIDPRMVSELKKRIAAIPEYRGKFTVIHKDFTKMPPNEIPPFDLCVSNCPYNISSGIVFRLLEIQPLPRKFVLMFQLEFAQRLAAEPGQDQYSRLTVNTKLLSKTKIIIRVSRNSFKPPPNVDSAVVEMYPVGPPPGLDLDEFNGLTRILFSKKNKTLGAIFKTRSLLNDLVSNIARLDEINRLHKPAQPHQYESSNLSHAASPIGNSPSVLTSVQLRERIAEALTEANLTDTRPNHMAIPDLLSLISLIHCSLLMLWLLLPVLLPGAVWAVLAAIDDPAARASAAFKEGRYREASDLYTSLIDAAQRPPAAYYFLRAASYEAQREIAKAVDDYHKVLVLSQKQDVKAYAEKAKLKMGRLCLTSCSLQCSKKYSLALLDPTTRTAIAKTDEQYRRAPGMTLAKLSELTETCSADPELSKIMLVSQFRTGADISDIRKTIERLVKTTTAAPFTLRSVLEIYEIVYLLQEGNFSSVTKRAKAALQMDPDDQFLGSAYKIARALSDGVTSFSNATPLSHKPNRTVIAKVFKDVDKAVSQIDKFFTKAESSAAFLLKDAFKTSFRPTLSGAKTQLMGALNNFRCISDLYFQKYTEEYCNFSDAMLVDTSKDLRISSFNKHLLALIYALRSNILLVSINNKYSRGQDIEDDVNLAEKIINYAHTLAIEANSPTQNDIETISDQVFTYVRKVIVPDFYKILGVSRSTPIAEVKRKYYRLAKEYHPDYTPADATEEEKAIRQRKFQRIAEAWSVLSDETKRKEYDSGQYRREELESREQAHQRRKMTKTNQSQQQEGFHFHTGGDGNQQFFRFNGDDHQFFRFMNGQQFFRM